ncbi:uncharacterized protein LOC131223751 [Magnolia sinica]|uniref:uncharacterized protein LOC131223751 n=1 Tax=Magnolia sinica TaxID=86752 RepID=UPI00265B62FD|nr:uncharacterized protein LOC131223751 [Magnolia sinica]
MDSSSANGRNSIKLSRSRKRKKIWIAISAFVLFVLLILLILGFTVFKPKHAITTVNSVKLSGMQVSLDPINLRVDLNVTLDLNISVKNPNPASFRFGNSSTLLYYRDGIVGEAGIPAGEILSHKTMDMNATLALMADRLVLDSNVYSDVLSGTLPLKTSTRIAGRVTVLNVFKHHLVSYTYCDLSINVWNRTVGKSDCKYRTKF